MELTMSQRARYARNIAVSEIGEEGQQKLLKSSVLIFGAGGLGSPAALYLAAAGVGTIGIVDSDSVDLSNLQRQIIHRMSSLSRPKTRSAAEALSALNPFVRTVLYQKRADGDSITDILRDRPWDFILDCTDNYPTKFLINDACVREKKPFCHAGFLRFAGQAMTYVPGKGPCLRCLFGGVPPEERSPSPAKFGVVGAVCGIFGSICTVREFCRFDGIFQKHSDRHGTYPAGHGRYPRCDGFGRGEINIAAKFSFGVSVHSDIDDNGSRFYHISGHEARFADGNDKDIRITGDGCNIFRF